METENEKDKSIKLIYFAHTFYVDIIKCMLAKHKTASIKVRNLDLEMELIWKRMNVAKGK